MTIDQLQKSFPDENACRAYLESVIWRYGRFCPHCGSVKSWAIKGETARAGLYQCADCRMQFTVTTKTPMHSTKLPLWKWILAIYYMINTSKGMSSVYIGKMVGVSQKTAWKICHAIREMMDMSHEKAPALKGIVEVDEKYLGGKPRKEKGVVHKRGKGTSKQGILVMVERQGPVRAELIDSDSHEDIAPAIERHVGKDAHLMTDEHKVYRSIGKEYSGHSHVNHKQQEFARDGVHNNTAESFNAELERIKHGVFHYLSKKHLQRYVNEVAFRWNHRRSVPQENGKTKMVVLPFKEKLRSLLSLASWRQVRRTAIGSIYSCSIFV